MEDDSLWLFVVVIVLVMSFSILFIVFFVECQSTEYLPHECDDILLSGILFLLIEALRDLTPENVLDVELCLGVPHE